MDCRTIQYCVNFSIKRHKYWASSLYGQVATTQGTDRVRTSRDLSLHIIPVPTHPYHQSIIHIGISAHRHIIISTPPYSSLQLSL